MRGAELSLLSWEPKLATMIANFSLCPPRNFSGGRGAGARPIVEGVRVNRQGIHDEMIIALTTSGSPDIVPAATRDRILRALLA
jgi:hypothetical protein